MVSLILFWVGRQSFKIEKKRLAAEVELNKSKEKYRSLVDASTEGLIMLIGNNISFVNPVFERMSGFSSDEISKMKIEELVDSPEIVSGISLKESLVKNQVISAWSGIS